jgi:acetaldehyde dehydrogenase/alcohol dehydrogenase
VAIIDPQFTTTMPKSIIADTGMDVLTHALESYVSVLGSDYTNGLAMKAIELVFKYLPRSYNDPEDLTAKEKMHNASAIAGMAFTNAFLGINHSLAHKLGGEFHIPHGRANSILLPFVIEYNSKKPDKFAIFPKYSEFYADYRYAQISRQMGFGGSNWEEQISNLIKEVRTLAKSLGVPATIRECGVDEQEFLSKVETLAENAFEDQCTTSNPRYPLIKDLKALYLKAYYGE